MGKLLANEVKLLILLSEVCISSLFIVFPKLAYAVKWCVMSFFSQL